MKRIAVIGSCVAPQVLKSMPGRLKTYIQDAEVGDDTRFFGKISHNFAKPGNIADRLFNDMGKIAYMNTGIPAGVQQEIRSQLENVTKPKTIETTVNHSKLNATGVIFVDLTNELLPSVITPDEEFVLKANWDSIKHYFPQWFRDLVIKNVFQFDMYDKTMTMDRHHSLRKAVDLINSCNQPVVTVGNVYTNRRYDYISNCVIDDLAFYNSKTPFLKVNSQGQLNEMVNYKYIKKQIDRFYKVCQQPNMSPGWTWVNVEEDCFSDPKHMWGPHPIHLHPISAKVIGIKVEKIYDELTSELIMK